MRNETPIHKTPGFIGLITFIPLFFYLVNLLSTFDGEANLLLPFAVLATPITGVFALMSLARSIKAKNP